MPDQVFEQNGNFVVAMLTDRQAADMDALNQTKREELRQALLNQEKDQALEKRLKDLRSQAEITISPNIASSLKGENSQI